MECILSVGRSRRRRRPPSEQQPLGLLPAGDLRYREPGDIFGVAIRISNRWGGFQALRSRWLDHLGSTIRRSVLLIDEAQEMSPAVLNELRLLASARFESQSWLTVVLAGDGRLLEKLKREELVPLGSRIRTRLGLEAATREELSAALDHLLACAGNGGLMTEGLRATLVDHAAGNYRILASMGSELLMSAARQEIMTLDEKLYLEVYGRPIRAVRGLPTDLKPKGVPPCMAKNRASSISAICPTRR